MLGGNLLVFVVVAVFPIIRKEYSWKSLVSSRFITKADFARNSNQERLYPPYVSWVFQLFTVITGEWIRPHGAVNNFVAQRDSEVSLVAEDWRCDRAKLPVNWVGMLLSENKVARVIACAVMANLFAFNPLNYQDDHENFAAEAAPTGLGCG